MDSRIYQRGEHVIEQGEPAMEAFLIESGSVTIIFTKNGVTQELATLGEGEIFGESALFKGSDYGASARANGPLKVIPITPDILDAKVSACDPLIRAIIRMLMIRLRKANERLAGNAAD